MYSLLIFIFILCTYIRCRVFNIIPAKRAYIIHTCIDMFNVYIYKNTNLVYVSLTKPLYMLMYMQKLMYKYI